MPLPLTWIIPPLLGSLVHVGVYGYLARRYREPFLRAWTWGWVTYTLRFAVLVPASVGSGASGWLAASQLFALWSGVLLLRGAREFSGNRLGRAWVWVGSALSSWILVGRWLSVSFVAYTLPTFAFLGFVNLEAGRVLLRGGRLPGGGAAVRFAGISFLVWGIHKWDYPFLARIPAVAPWGYTLGAALGVAASLGLLVAYLESERTQADRSRRFLRAVLDAIPDRVLVVDAQLRVLDGNPAAGLIPGRHTGRPCRELHGQISGPCGDPGGDCPVSLAMERGETVRLLRDTTGPGGQPLALEVLATPLNDAGRVIGAVAVGRDVTERAELMARLARAKAQWESTFDAVPDGVVVVGADRRVRRINRALAKRLGHTPRELVGRSLDEAQLAALENVSMIRGFGEWRSPELGGVFLVSATPVEWGGEDAEGWVYVARDITRQKEAEGRLARERQNLHALLTTMSDGVVGVDRRGTITFVNRAVVSLWGGAKEGMVGRPFRSVFAQWGKNELAEAVERVLTTGDPWAGESTLVVEGRIKREMDVRILPLRPDGGAVRGGVVVFRDITDTRALERERVRIQHLEALGVFAGGIAHDFNNLLMGISGNLELAERRLDRSPESAARMIRGARDACARGAGIARQLLTFARGGEPALKRVDLTGMIEDWVRFPLAGSAVTPEVRVAPGLPEVEIDVEQVHQVVTNLVVNARQAMPAGGRIRVRAETVEVSEDPAGSFLQPGTYVRITVADQGCGIPPDHLGRIFDPYFTTKPSGSGLGLATAHSVIRRHGGAIDVASQVGVGTTFSVYLPVAQGEAEPEEGLPSTPGGCDLQGRRVLAMDDDPVLQEILWENLASTGCRAVVVSDGEQAVTAFHEALDQGEPYEAVILDLTVQGGMGGLETVGRIRELKPDAFVVAVSGYAEAPVMTRPAAFGFDASLPKPYAFSDLCRVIGEGIGSST